MTTATADVPARIAITGSSGLYGRALVAEIRRRLPGAQILGIDLRPAAGDPPDDFLEGHVADPAHLAAIARFAPDTIVHLAYAVQPGRNAAALRATNVDGTRTLLEMAATLRPLRLPAPRPPRSNVRRLSPNVLRCKREPENARPGIFPGRVFLKNSHEAATPV